MENELLERCSTLRHDEQADRGPAGNEGLLDGTATGNELLVLADLLGWRKRRRPGRWSVGSPARPPVERRAVAAIRTAIERRSRAARSGTERSVVAWSGLPGPVTAGGPALTRAIVTRSVVAGAVLPRSIRRAERTPTRRAPIEGSALGPGRPVAPRAGCRRSLAPRSVEARAGRSWSVGSWSRWSEAVRTQPLGTAVTAPLTGVAWSVEACALGPRAAVARTRSGSSRSTPRPRAASRAWPRTARPWPIALRSARAATVLRRSISHERSRRSVASAGHRACPRRPRHGQPTRHEGGRRPPSRARSARPSGPRAAR
jgi:hypothetical protein